MPSARKKVVDGALNMHINHRRKNFPLTYRGRYWPLYSCKWYRRKSWSRRRARAREHMHHERFDLIPIHYRRDILYYAW